MAHVLDQIQDLANESDRFKNKHINATDVAIRIYLEFPVATSARLEASCNNGGIYGVWCNADVSYGRSANETVFKH